MNDGASSNSGIPRSAFPEGVPTFSGHFHKPHTVGGRDGFIRYVGSPYQVHQKPTNAQRVEGRRYEIWDPRT